MAAGGCGGGSTRRALALLTAGALAVLVSGCSGGGSAPAAGSSPAPKVAPLTSDDLARLGRCVGNAGAWSYAPTSAAYYVSDWQTAAGVLGTTVDPTGQVVVVVLRGHFQSVFGPSSSAQGPAAPLPAVAFMVAPADFEGQNGAWICSSGAQTDHLVELSAVPDLRPLGAATAIPVDLVPTAPPTS